MTAGIHALKREQEPVPVLRMVSPGNTDENEPVIDIHQHTHYSGRSDELLLAHQKVMGIQTGRAGNRNARG